MISYIPDTTVLVDSLRGNSASKRFLEKHLPSISFVTKAELIQGTRKKSELKDVMILCGDLQILPATPDISMKSLELLSTFHLSHGFRFIDAIIAATAMAYTLTLVTSNMKHFSFIPKLNIIDWKIFEKEKI